MRRAGGTGVVSMSFALHTLPMRWWSSHLLRKLDTVARHRGSSCISVCMWVWVDVNLGWVGSGWEPCSHMSSGRGGAGRHGDALQNARPLLRLFIVRIYPTCHSPPPIHDAPSCFVACSVSGLVPTGWPPHPHAPLPPQPLIPAA